MTHRSHLLATTLLAAVWAAPALAQTAAPAEPATPDTVVEEGQTIVVTGSLLTNPNLAQAAPVNVTTAEEIELSQNNLAEEVLRDIPGIVPNVGSAVNNGNGGASFVDLRGLGSFRNLVLLDGQRIAPSNALGRVDLNNIPLALIERVDALTGGASTTYGADAVSGVVNFITRKNFSGIEVSLGEQITEQGDGNFMRADVTLGANFDDGRGNTVFSIGYQESDPVYQGDRDFSLDSINSASGIYSGSGTSVPSTFSGTRPIDPLTGLPSIDPTVANGGNRQVQPANGSAVAPYAPFNFNPFNVFQTPFKRYNMYGQANYQASDALEVYTRGLFSKNVVRTIIAPSGAFGLPVNINLNNPLLPTALRRQFCAFDVNPVATIYTPRFDPATCDAAATATGRTDPLYREIGTGGFVAFDTNQDGTIAAGEGYNPNPQVTLARRAVEAGPRISEFTTTIFDYRAGLRGPITDTINWDISGAYGESENRLSIQGFTVNSRVQQGLLVNGTAAAPVCQSTANGCVPVNVFGALGTISQAAANFLVVESTVFNRTTLAQGRALISGDLGFNSPFAEDWINFALGGEYRSYSAQQRSDTLAQSGELGGSGGAAPNISGGYDVYEAIGEIGIPLVQDKPFFNALQLNAGIRYSHYTIDSPTQPKFNTTTWKIEGVWEPVRDVKIRGGFARSVRAPNINELFAPLNTVLTNLNVDPCATVLANGTRQFAAPTGALRAVCLAQGASLGNVDNIVNPTAGQANVTTGGNVNVKPEKSNSYTIGAVIQPSFLSGFSATIDYYNITIKDAITTPASGDLISACFGNGNASNGGAGIPANAAASAACTQIRRNPLTGGLDGLASTTPGLLSLLTNQGRLKTDGIDVALSYRTPLAFAGDDVKLALTFTGNYTFNSKFKANQASATSVDRDCTGYFSANCGISAGSITPKFQWSQRTTISFGDVDVSLLWRHIDKMRYESLAPDCIARGFAAAAGGGCVGLFRGNLPATGGSGTTNGRAVDFNRIKAYDYFDLALRFGLTKNVDVTLVAQNLFDKQPPLVGNTAGSTAFNSGNTYPSTYDALGRRYAAGLKLKF